MLLLAKTAAEVSEVACCLLFTKNSMPVDWDMCQLQYECYGKYV